MGCLSDKTHLPILLSFFLPSLSFWRCRNLSNFQWLVGRQYCCFTPGDHPCPIGDSQVSPTLTTTVIIPSSHHLMTSPLTSTFRISEKQLSYSKKKWGWTTYSLHKQTEQNTQLKTKKWCELENNASNFQPSKQFHFGKYSSAIDDSEIQNNHRLDVKKPYNRINYQQKTGELWMSSSNVISNNQKPLCFNLDAPLYRRPQALHKRPGGQSSPPGKWDLHQNHVPCFFWV